MTKLSTVREGGHAQPTSSGRPRMPGGGGEPSSHSPVWPPPAGSPWAAQPAGVGPRAKAAWRVAPPRTERYSGRGEEILAPSSVGGYECDGSCCTTVEPVRMVSVVLGITSNQNITLFVACSWNFPPQTPTISLFSDGTCTILA